MRFVWSLTFAENCFSQTELRKTKYKISRFLHPFYTVSLLKKNSAIFVQQTFYLLPLPPPPGLDHIIKCIALNHYIERTHETMFVAVSS